MNKNTLVLVGGLLAVGVAAAGDSSTDGEQAQEQTTEQTQTRSQATSSTTSTGTRREQIEAAKQSLIGSTRDLGDGGKAEVIDAEYRPERSDVSPWRVKLRTLSEVDSEGISDRWTRDTGDTYWTQVMSQ